MHVALWSLPYNCQWYYTFGFQTCFFQFISRTKSNCTKQRTNGKASQINKTIAKLLLNYSPSWFVGEKRMRFCISCWADSSERAHSVRKCSLVKDIIQHVEYPALTAPVKKIAQQATEHLRNSLCKQSRMLLSWADSSSVRRALGTQKHRCICVQWILLHTHLAL